MHKARSFFQAVFFLSALSLLSSCGWLEKYSDEVKMQSITVLTPMADGAKCKVSDSRGNRYDIKKTPDFIVVRQGFSPLTFMCDKKGYKRGIAYVDEDRVVQSTVNLPDEMIGMFENPLARSATEYQREVVVWLQPLRWNSEQHMRDWAFERSLYDQKQYLLEQKKVEAYRKLEEERLFFKSWANNRFDRTQRASKSWQALTEKELADLKALEESKGMTDEMDGFALRYNEILRKIQPEMQEAPVIDKVYGTQ